MKPKKIRVTDNVLEISWLKVGTVYDVKRWYSSNSPIILNDNGYEEALHPDEWEPVSEFNHGDPVWAWDDASNHKDKGIYLCPTLNNDEGYEHYVECDYGPDPYQNIEHRKPQMTLQELADKAGINLDEVEIVD